MSELTPKERAEWIVNLVPGPGATKLDWLRFKSLVELELVEVQLVETRRVVQQLRDLIQQAAPASWARLQEQCTQGETDIQRVRAWIERIESEPPRREET